MLYLSYVPQQAGAPADYGETRDTLFLEQDGSATELQTFRKKNLVDRPPADAPDPRLLTALSDFVKKRGADTRPVVLMVHGYSFNPRDAQESPLASVYGFPHAVPPGPDHRMSWMPLVGECDEAGGNLAENAIGFSYNSMGGSLTDYGQACWSNSYQYALFDLSPLAARALASLITALSAHPAQRFRIFAHSLGTRTTSPAVGLLGGKLPANLDRILLLNGAEFSVDAARNFATCTSQVINILNTKDAVLDLGGEGAGAPIRPNESKEACVIGRDGLGGNTNWIDLQLDNPAICDRLAAMAGGACAISPDPTNTVHPQSSMRHWCS